MSKSEVFLLTGPRAIDYLVKKFKGLEKFTADRPRARTYSSSDKIKDQILTKSTSG